MSRPGRIRQDRRHSQSGGAAVEFALVFPIFCTVMFGMIDYGWYFYQRFSLAAAVRDGIRVGSTVSQSVTPDPSAVAIDQATKDLTASGMTVLSNTFTTSTSFTTTTVPPLKMMTLTGVYTFVPLVNFVPLPAKSMTYSMTMLLEQQQ